MRNLEHSHDDSHPFGHPILKYSDSNFDADDWASVGVPRASLLLSFLPPSPSLRSTCRSSRKRWAVGRSEHRLGHPSESERVLAGCHSHSAARSESGARPESQPIELKVREMPAKSLPP